MPRGLIVWCMQNVLAPAFQLGSVTVNLPDLHAMVRLILFVREVGFLVHNGVSAEVPGVPDSLSTFGARIFASELCAFAQVLRT